MPRNRVIYQSESLYVGPTPATGSHYVNEAIPSATGSLIKEILRVQSANYSFNKTFSDVNQFNQLASISREVIQEPTVSLDFSYLQASLYNERVIGFTISSGTFTSAITSILNKTQDEKNYFIKTVPEGYDALNLPANSGSVFGFGNGFISSYTAEGSVGNFPTASVRVECANMTFDSTASGNPIPAIDPSNGMPIAGKTYVLPVSLTNPTGSVNSEIAINVLKPGDIVLEFGSFTGYGAAIPDMKIQNYSISLDLPRDPMRKLGTKFPFSREVRFPTQVSLSVTAELGDMNTGNLAYLLSSQPIDVGVKIYRPDTTTRNDSQVAAYYLIRGAELESQSYSSSIGANKSVTLNFVSQIGGPNQTTRGLFLSGVN